MSAPLRVVHIEDEPWDSGIAHYAATLAAEQKRHGWDVWGNEVECDVDLKAPNVRAERPQTAAPQPE